jgi:hypothetical protein
VLIVVRPNILKKPNNATYIFPEIIVKTWQYNVFDFLLSILSNSLFLHTENKGRYYTGPLYTTVAIFSAPEILSEFQNKSVQSVLENVMKAAIVSAAPARSGWAP